MNTANETEAVPDNEKIRQNPYPRLTLRSRPSHLGLGAGRGLVCCFNGLRYMYRNPGLIPFAVLPVIINTVVMSLSFALSFWWLLNYAMGQFEGHQGTWWYWPAMILALLVVLVTAVIIMLMVWIFMRATVSAWFEAKLAEECAKRINAPIIQDDSSTFRYILETSALFGGLLIVNIAILLLNFIPFIGSILSIVLGYYVNSWAAGWQYFGLALEQRGLPLGERFKFSMRHHGDVVATGAWVMLLGIFPLVGPITLSGTVVGSVLLSTRLWELDLEQGKIPQPEIVSR